MALSFWFAWVLQAQIPQKVCSMPRAEFEHRARSIQKIAICQDDPKSCKPSLGFNSMLSAVATAAATDSARSMVAAASGDALKDLENMAKKIASDIDAEETEFLKSLDEDGIKRLKTERTSLWTKFGITPDTLEDRLRGLLKRKPVDADAIRLAEITSTLNIVTSGSFTVFREARIHGRAVDKNSLQRLISFGTLKLDENNVVRGSLAKVMSLNMEMTQEMKEAAQHFAAKRLPQKLLSFLTYNRSHLYEFLERKGALTALKDTLYKATSTSFTSIAEEVMKEQWGKTASFIGRNTLRLALGVFTPSMTVEILGAISIAHADCDGFGGLNPGITKGLFDTHVADCSLLWDLVNGKARATMSLPPEDLVQLAEQTTAVCDAVSRNYEKYFSKWEKKDCSPGSMTFKNSMGTTVEIRGKDNSDITLTGPGYDPFTVFVDPSTRVPIAVSKQRFVDETQTWVREGKKPFSRTSKDVPESVPFALVALAPDLVAGCTGQGSQIFPSRSPGPANGTRVNLQESSR